MKIGVISDTHGFLDPRVPELFAGVEHILHGGDIGPAHIIAALEKIAPVTAVLGNNDFDPQWRETEVVALAGRTFLVHHIVNPSAPADGVKQRILRENPGVVVFGHTHSTFNERRGRVLFFNPGYAGKPRFHLPRSVAVLHCSEKEIRPEFFGL